MKNSYELAYIASETEVRSKIYDNREGFINDFQIVKASGKPMMAQGPSKTGSFEKITVNGWNDDDVILTAVVNFGFGKEYTYSAGKHYSGMYEVAGAKGNSIASVKYEWRMLDDFRAELFEAGYDNPTRFESILVRKVVG